MKMRKCDREGCFGRQKDGYCKVLQTTPNRECSFFKTLDEFRRGQEQYGGEIKTGYPSYKALGI